mgnify:CR=1 FL=1|tara:strand:- start:694 stop:1020 length:327 start_codon:yes stop_codon:yes gene_type:complete
MFLKIYLKINKGLRKDLIEDQGSCLSSNNPNIFLFFFNGQLSLLNCVPFGRMIRNKEDVKKMRNLEFFIFFFLNMKCLFFFWSLGALDLLHKEEEGEKNQSEKRCAGI